MTSTTSRRLISGMRRAPERARGAVTAIKDGQAVDETLQRGVPRHPFDQGRRRGLRLHRCWSPSRMPMRRARPAALGRAGPRRRQGRALIRANDIVADFVAAARSGTAPRAGFGEDELRELHALAARSRASGGAGELDDIDFTPVRADRRRPRAGRSITRPARRSGTIRFAPSTELFRAPTTRCCCSASCDARHARRRGSTRGAAARRFRAVRRYCAGRSSSRLAEPREAVDREVFEFVEGTAT